MIARSSSLVAGKDVERDVELFHKVGIIMIIIIIIIPH